MKIIKKVVAAFLLLICTIVSGGLVKYNIDLNDYLTNKTTSNSKVKQNNASNETKVYIIGTVHDETEKIKRDDLYYLIDSIAPSIILMEGDSSRVRRIVKERKELTDYKDFATIHTNYWDIRNKEMAQNILKQIKLNPNQVILVLNGFYHRYYLIEELKKFEKKFSFSVIEA